MASAFLIPKWSRHGSFLHQQLWPRGEQQLSAHDNHPVHAKPSLLGLPNEQRLCENPLSPLGDQTTFFLPQATSIITSRQMLTYLAATGYQIFIYSHNGQRFSTAVGYHCPFSLGPIGCQPTLLFNLFPERAHSVGILRLCLVLGIQGIPTTHPHDDKAQQSEL